MTARDTLDAAKAETRAIYERHALAWDRHRSRDLYEAPWLERVAASLPKAARVLDLGCGAGAPVSAWFLDRGYRVTGVDYAAPMIDLARKNFPQGDWIVGDMRALDLTDRYDAVISWDGFFHLSQEEQRSFLDRLPGLLMPKAVLLLTVGYGDGEVTGTVQGETVYHASLSPDEYRQRLEETGFTDITYVPNDPETRGRSVLLARRSNCRSPVTEVG